MKKIRKHSELVSGLAITGAAIMATALNCHAQPKSGAGQKWVREHRFQIGAFVESPINLERYKVFNFSAYVGGTQIGRMSDDQLTKLYKGVPEAGLDAHWFSWYRPEQKHTPEMVTAAARSMRDLKIPIVGYSIGDESPQAILKEVGAALNAARKEAPDALVYSAMRGKDFPEYGANIEAYNSYLNAATKDLRPDVMIPNYYPFYRGGTGLYMFDNMEAIRRTALAANVPYWNWLQSFSWTDGPFHVQSESEVRMQAFASLTYGYSGLFFWGFTTTYPPYSQSLVDRDHNLTTTGTAVRDMVPELKHLGEVIKNLTSTSVSYVPGRYFFEGHWREFTPIGTTKFTNGAHPFVTNVQTSPGRNGFILGSFKDDDADYVMITNANHGQNLSSTQTAGAVSVQFSPDIQSLQRLNRHTGKYETVQLEENMLQNYVLPGGTGDLFKIVKAQ